MFRVQGPKASVLSDPIYFTQGLNVVHHSPPVSFLKTGVLKGSAAVAPITIFV